METLTGIYMGIVVNTIPDPERRLRVQVYIPHLSSRIFIGWDQGLIDRYIRNLFEMPIETQMHLSQTLPWAECAAPLWGGGTPINFNAPTQRITINGGISLKKPKPEEKIENPNPWNVAILDRRKRIHTMAIAPIDATVCIMDNCYNNASFVNGKEDFDSHEKAAKGTEIEKSNKYYPYKVPDWNDSDERAQVPEERKMKGSGPLNGASTPQSQEDGKTTLVQQLDYIGWGSKPTDIGTTGSPNGMFSVPALGAKVWVFFIHGDFQRPVYFANVIEQTTGISV